MDIAARVQRKLLLQELLVGHATVGIEVRQALERHGNLLAIKDDVVRAFRERELHLRQTVADELQEGVRGLTVFLTMSLRETRRVKQIDPGPAGWANGLERT